MKWTYLQRFAWPKKSSRFFGLHWRALSKFYDDNGFFLSSGIAFNILINLIPLIMLLSAVAGMYLYSDLEVFNRIHLYLAEVAPTLDPNIMKGLISIIQTRQITGIVGFGALILLSMWVFSSLRIALKIVFRVEKSRGILRGIAMDLLMVLFAELLLLANMGLSSYIIIIQSFDNRIFLAIEPAIQWFLKYMIPFSLAFCMYFLVYKIIPPKKVHAKSAIRAAFFAGMLWEVAKHLFEWYILHIARYSDLYGSLSTFIVFVLWVYYSSVIFVMGGEYLYFLEEDRQKAAIKP